MELRQLLISASECHSSFVRKAGGTDAGQDKRRAYQLGGPVRSVAVRY